ncbi:RNA recognition motif domain-containing protein [Limnoglobus roseus]|uniref:RNA-binding protein n=1 Tax=Limnoglobus roseus TaxID=2598579 RepID=A0A5C1AIE8_9BACT|nr:RNA-binding protein [Limnoglobus roseus]QEL17452.1 RNA-binding protein [Limnoglobus roseus]
MDTKLYVSNVALTTTDETLFETFTRYGAVSRARVVVDRGTKRSRGFAYVEMSDGAQQAIEGLSGSELDGSVLTVELAKPRNNTGMNRDGFDGGIPRLK